MLSEPKVNILLVDDQPENLLALEAILGDLGENLVRAYSGEEAFRHLLKQDFAVILLDVQMPDMDGFEVATLIRQREKTRETPIIFLTAFSTSESFMFRGYALGAVDYLIKPIAPNILKSKVAVFIELFKKNEALRQKTTQLEAINAELLVSEERFRSLSTCSPMGIFVTDPDGQCLYTNPRFETLCGFAEGRQSSQNWLQAVSAEDQEQAALSWSTYLQGQPEYSREFRLHSHSNTENDAPRWVHVRSARMLSDQGQFLGYVGTLEEITERRQAEAANAQMIREQAARQEAEAANRMKDEFIAVLSHELRTPLNAILGWARLVSSRECDAATISHAIEIIERNANAQAKLIEDILDVSQIIRGKLQLERQPVDLAVVALAALETVQSQAEEKGVTLAANFPRDPSPQVLGDPFRLQQVVWNLLTNAVKFTSAGGRVEVSLTTISAQAVGLRPDEAADCEHDGYLGEAAMGSAGAADAPADALGWAEIRVTDTGVGISPEFLPYVFERFRQADSTTTRNHGGLGLGLAIVRHLVEQHHGQICANSPGVGQGATFTVRLPLLSSQNYPVQSSFTAQPLRDSSLNGVQVLVVDD
ncbi:MAG TPA: ATP-binding protein, partial [Trichocoleus sp.]